MKAFISMWNIIAGNVIIGYVIFVFDYKSVFVVFGSCKGIVCNCVLNSVFVNFKEKNYLKLFFICIFTSFWWIDIKNNFIKIKIYFK
jgi:hypothetical protein